MKKFFYLLFIIILGSILFTNTREFFYGAEEGLLLWFRTVVPTLFPFLFIGNFLQNSKAGFILEMTVGKTMARLFRVSPVSSTAVLCGFLFGCPVGAKTASDLYKEKKITDQEAKYLLSFCNNTSPMFLTGYLVVQHLQKESLIVPALLIYYAGILISGLLFRRFLYPELKQNEVFSRNREQTLILSRNMDRSIESGCNILIKLGGYLMLFSVLIRFMDHRKGGFLWKYILLPSMEMTNGIHRICVSSLPYEWKFVLTMGLVSFGGWCCVFQTDSITGQYNWPLGIYIKEKLVTAMVTSLIAILFVWITG